MSTLRAPRSSTSVALLFPVAPRRTHPLQGSCRLRGGGADGPSAHHTERTGYRVISSSGVTITEPVVTA
jgi:hypothetical protein